MKAATLQSNCDSAAATRVYVEFSLSPLRELRRRRASSKRTKPAVRQSPGSCGKALLAAAGAESKIHFQARLKGKF